MEVLVSDALSVPEDCVISIRAGNTRRQAPLDVAKSQSLKFSSTRSALNEPLKIDVLLPIATTRLVLHPHEDEYMIGFHDQAEMALGLTVKTSDPAAAREKVQSRPASAMIPSLNGKMDSATNARDYLEKHGVLKYVQSLLHAIIQVRPQDPYGFMTEQLLASKPKHSRPTSAQTAPFRPSTELPRAPSPPPDPPAALEVTPASKNNQSSKPPQDFEAAASSTLPHAAAAMAAVAQAKFAEQTLRAEEAAARAAEEERLQQQAADAAQASQEAAELSKQETAQAAEEERLQQQAADAAQAAQEAAKAVRTAEEDASAVDSPTRGICDLLPPAASAAQDRYSEPAPVISHLETQFELRERLRGVLEVSVETGTFERALKDILHHAADASINAEAEPENLQRLRQEQQQNFKKACESGILGDMQNARVKGQVSKAPFPATSSDIDDRHHMLGALKDARDSGLLVRALSNNSVTDHPQPLAVHPPSTRAARPLSAKQQTQEQATEQPAFSVLSQELPPGWKVVWSEEEKDYYYWHEPTDVTQWDVPVSDPVLGANTSSTHRDVAAESALASLNDVDQLTQRLRTSLEEAWCSGKLESKIAEALPSMPQTNLKEVEELCIRLRETLAEACSSGKMDAIMAAVPATEPSQPTANRSAQAENLTELCIGLRNTLTEAWESGKMDSLLKDDIRLRLHSMPPEAALPAATGPIRVDEEAKPDEQETQLSEQQMQTLSDEMQTLSEEHAALNGQVDRLTKEMEELMQTNHSLLEKLRAKGVG
eukprot:TRINITY_DN2605_c0_g1_i1.p1 TRINITY_DN2605_c0_g1~~TRINITY_DN2605_c0_g1_i1.p1  ORF type:complete len:773 (+),score=187.73 TRINITY_DN2605_c0_g1_i1:49-2367(+)